MTDGLSDQELRALMDAGSSALTFNAPLGQQRAGELIASVAARNPVHVVDFGCGRGALATAIAGSADAINVLGIDSIAEFVSVAAEGSLARFEVADASTWSGPCDLAISIGSSHAFGGLSETLERFADLGAAHVVIGDGFWSTQPDEWCLDIFGAQPSSLDAVGSVAEAGGWVVDELGASTLEEWDAFEGGWRAGVRSVGSEAAHAFADEREAEYANYRGVLGFAWLLASRTV